MEILWSTNSVSKIYAFISIDENITRYVFVKHGCSHLQWSQNLEKSLSPTVLPCPTQGAYDVSEVWATLRWTLMSKFGYLITTQTLNIALYVHVGGTELCTEGLTDEWTDTRQSDN